MNRLTIPILFGSVRHDRAGIRACRWIMHEIEARGHEPVLIDAAAIGLPLLDRMYKEFAPGAAPVPLDELADPDQRHRPAIDQLQPVAPRNSCRHAPPRGHRRRVTVTAAIAAAGPVMRRRHLEHHQYLAIGVGDRPLLRMARRPDAERGGTAQGQAELEPSAPGHGCDPGSIGSASTTCGVARRPSIAWPRLLGAIRTT
jgi:hypothetical protein